MEDATVNGKNGDDRTILTETDREQRERKLTQKQEEEIARQMAVRYRLEFIELKDFQIDHALFRSIPVDLMFRYNFVPFKRDNGTLYIVVSDPSEIMVVDELELLLGVRIKLLVGTQSSIQDILKKSESSQRVLEEATETFRMQIVSDDEDSEDALTIDKLTTDSSPIIKLVDSIIFNAIQRRASDIHIETKDVEVLVKYRIDGVLQYALEPIDKKYHSSIISRIKVMSELDIAEKRVPQDGRFKLRIKNKAIDFRVSIMPSVHGEDSVIRILDKESINENFVDLRLNVL